MVNNVFLKFTGKVNRRSPRTEGKPEDPVVRENWLSRDGKLSAPRGTESAIDTVLSDTPTWIGRYYSTEIGRTIPKTLAYTQDGKIWYIDENARTATMKNELLNEDAYPKHWLVKKGEQTIMYFVDGKDLYKYDGNLDYKLQKITITDTDGNSITPIDVIEHLDRLVLISKRFVYISKNLDFDVFNDSTDSIQIVVGSGKGENLALGKIEDRLFIFNTEGIFALYGDVISALASTFEVRLVDETKIIAGRTAVKVNQSILFLADDFELYAWDGQQARLLSYLEKLSKDINTNRGMLDKAVATYEDNYYKMSFVEKGETTNNLEVWWDAFEDKIDFVRGRNVSFYMQTDTTVEQEYKLITRSDFGGIMYADRGYNFDGHAIVKRLRTRDIVIKKGANFRFSAFYPEIEPTGGRTIQFVYHLDGRLSLISGSRPFWDETLRGETKGVGAIIISNQTQFMGRVRPVINYSRGNSIAFELTDSTKDLRCDLIGIGVDYITKARKKGKGVGQ